MGKITVTPCDIEGLYVIEPTVFKDERGYFVETYNQNDFRDAGLDMIFVQDNQSCSSKGVLRGLHFQKSFPQGKLVRVIKGSVFDVAVDLRSGSGTYGKWFGIELTEVEGSDIKIPVHSRVAIVCSMKEYHEVGDHYLYICDVEQVYGNEVEEALFAWNGYSQVRPAK